MTMGKVGSDLFELKGVPLPSSDRLLLILCGDDKTVKKYFSKCDLCIKIQFSRYGIPDVLISDNSPQCSAKEI